ncbi:hypothetical protein JCM8208_000472 [Rhodotorula glutinis]
MAHNTTAFRLVARASAVDALRGSGPASLNWLYLVECFVVFILVLFYFFYIQRVLGIVASWVLRLYFWRSSNAYFEIGALKISILGGRIQFNDLRYISRNQSLRVVRGHVTWKYWLRHVRSEEDKPSEARKPCRVQITFSGAELFLYNRTPSYDAILEQLGLKEQDPLRRGPSEPSDSSSTSSPPSSLDKKEKQSLSPSSPRPSTAVSSIEQVQAEQGEKERERRKQVDEGKKDGTNWLLEALPIAVECSRGAIVMGNPSTPSILIAGFDGVNGTYSAGKARSKLDDYKEVYHFVFRRPKIVWRTNPDYKEGMADHGQHLMDRLDTDIHHFSLASLFARPTAFLTLRGFRDLVMRRPHPSRRERRRHAHEHDESEKEQAHDDDEPHDGWAGLPRYQTPEDDASVDPDAKPPHVVEYAKVATLLVSDEIDMTYYSDAAGLVPERSSSDTPVAGLETYDVGNGGLSPEWGVDLVVRGAALTYGPWADRQRAKIQSAFLPATYFNGLETPKLKPGDQRMHTALKVYVEFSDGATLRVPTRESSKDWKYDSPGLEHSADPVVRKYGWLDVALGPNSTMTYFLPMVATKAGYDTLLELHLDDISASSSVNHETFFHAESCRIGCGLPSPLVWDEKRTWTITTKIARPDISLLRDHVTLFTDVAQDWTSGPAGDYDHFVPFVYKMDVEVRDYAIQLFLNDHNIISNATAPEDNALLTLSGPALDAHVVIPSDAYRQECTNIQFTTSIVDLVLSMSLPDWNTHSAFMTDRTRTFATAAELILDGSYRIYAHAHPDNVEKLSLRIKNRDVVFKAFGWVIRHLFNLKENYFGSFTHYVTFDEYKRRHSSNLQGDPLELKYRPGKTDVSEVSVQYELENGLLLLPQEIYDCSKAIVLALPQLSVDLRNHDFFMEMSLNVDPFRILETVDTTAFLQQDFGEILEQQGDLVRVDGLEIGANRLFGPQPRTATYLCIWSFDIGSIVGSVPPCFVQSLMRAGGAVGLTFTDSDNAPAPDYVVPVDPDITALTVQVRSLDVAVRGTATAVQLYLPHGVDLRFDDLATAPFLKHLRLEVPELTLRALAPLFGRSAPWMEVASVDVDLSVVLGLSHSGWEARAREQLAFVALQDGLTKRCPFLYGHGDGSSSRCGSLFLPAIEGPVRSFPRASVHVGSPSSTVRLESVAEESEGDLTPDGRSDLDDSETSDDDAHTLYTRLAGRDEAGDRFSAYGVVLQLCERAPEAAFLDRPTFRRLYKNGARRRPPSTTSAGSTMERLREFGHSQHPDRSEARTCVDISSQKGLRLVLTPVAVSVGSDVLDGINVDTDLEHCLDDLYTEFLDAQHTVAKTRYGDLELKASLPLVQVDLIQDVLRPEDTISFRQRDNRHVDEHASATVLSTVQLVLSNISLGFRQLVDHHGGVDRPLVPMPSAVVELEVNGSAGQTRLLVFHPEQSTIPGSTRRSHVLPRGDEQARERPTALDLILGRCDARIDYNAARALVSLVGRDAQLDFVDEAAELIIGALWSWRVVSNIIVPIKQREVEREMFLRHLVYAVAVESDSAGVTTVPTFLNRVSYLVGSSGTLRVDDGWKSLHNLRHCLRLAHADVADLLARRGTWPDQSEMRDHFLRILRRQSAWDVDVDDFQHSPLVRRFYGSSEAAHELHGASALDWALALPVAVEWSSGTLDARFWTDAGTSNSLAVGKIDAYLASSGLDSDQDELRLRTKATLEGVDAHVDRDLLVLIRHILGVRNVFERKIQRFSRDLAASTDATTTSTAAPPEDVFAALPGIVLDASLAIQHIGAVANADELEAQAVVSDATMSMFGRTRPAFDADGLLDRHLIDLSTSATIGSLSFAARERRAHKSEVLLSADLDGPSALVTAQGTRAMHGASSLEMVHVVLGTQAVRFRIPRDAVRSYEFIENWRTSSLPVYDSLLTDLRVGLDDLPTSQDAGSIRTLASTGPSSLSKLLEATDVKVQAAVSLVELTAQAVPTLQASYVVRNLSAFADSKGSPQADLWLGEIVVGMQVGQQSVRFVPVHGEVDRGDDSPTLPNETSFELPVIRLNGRADSCPCHHVSVLTTVEPISVKLTADIIDNVLTVQRHFGNDIDELVRLVQAKRPTTLDDSTSSSASTASSSSPASSGAASPSELSSSPSIAWDARVALRGFKIAVQGPQAVQWLETELLEAQASSSEAGKLQWQAVVQNLALSLAQRTTHDDDGAVDAALASSSDRRYRLAFFRLNLNVSNARIDLPNLPGLAATNDADTPHLHVRLPRVHAVIQPNAIEALGDLVDHYVQEMEDRRTSRRQDIEALQTRVVQTLDIKADDKAKPSWLSTCVVSVEAQSIGVAIPLSDEGVAGITAVREKRRHKSAQSRPAFLVSLASVQFGAQKGSAGCACISRFSANFVGDFDQGRKEDFDGDTHQSLNRIVLPDMTCTLRSPQGAPVLVHSKVSGLEVDLEPTVVAFAFALIDVYRLSHERFAKFAPELSPGLDTDTPTRPALCPARPAATAATPAVQATFEFASGTIRMHSHVQVVGGGKDGLTPPTSPGRRPKPHRRGKSLGEFATLRHVPGKAPHEATPDVFRLPALSMWAEYRDDDDELVDSRLHVDCVIHKSHNTLYPTLLPFISAVVQQVKLRAVPVATATAAAAPEPSTHDLSPIAESPTSPSGGAPLDDFAAPLGKLQLTISLRIDQSKLEISCLPAAEVTARLTWESGGFFFSTSPQTKGVTFAVSVDGVSAGLRHLFSPEDCLSLEAKGLAASLSFGALEGAGLPTARLLSVVVNLPDVSASMNFRHLQDWLCLKAVWIDRIDLGPVLSSETATTVPTPAPSTSSTASSVTALVRAEMGSLRFACDFGPSIGRITFVAHRMAMRYRQAPEVSREFSFEFESLESSGQGRAGGTARVDGLRFFNRMREHDCAHDVMTDATDLLNLRIELGKIAATVEYEFHRILVLDGDPVVFEVLDDWSHARDHDPALSLRIKVDGGTFSLLGTTATVATILGVGQRIGALVDEKRAAADAVIAGAGLPPRPTSASKAENAISRVASRLGQDGGGGDSPACPVRIVNHLEFNVEAIRLAMFQDRWNDGDVYRADAGSGIRAKLVRDVDSEQQVHRNLSLYLGFFSIRRVAHRKVTPTEEGQFGVDEWYALLRKSKETNIMKHAATDVKMESWEVPGSFLIRHRFDLAFGGQLDVALNWALLRNLSALSTQYRLQMDRIANPSTRKKSDAAPQSLSPPTAPQSALPTPPLDAADAAASTAKLERPSTIVKMKPLPLVQVASKERRSLTFEAIEMHITDPKLTFLGDATPPLEWLGLQRSRFPAVIHTGVTAPLEQLLVFLSSTYGSQLARNKFSGRRAGKADRSTTTPAPSPGLVAPPPPT